MTGILTYHKKMACYESSWLIFLKALIINDISIKDLISLVVKRHVPIVESQIKWSESFQFNLFALRSTLGLSPQAVDDAFVDRLLISTFSGGTGIVRHCSVCVKHLYHCTLFQLPWITHCPLHHVQLEECKGCSGVFSQNKLGKIRARDWGGICKHLCTFMKPQFPVHTLSNEEVVALFEWGSELTTWLGKSREVADEDTLRIVGVPLAAFDISARFVYWRYLETKVGASPLDISAPAYEASRLSLEPLNRLPKTGSDRERLSVIACFKSLRRHIYSRFVKRHHRCVNEFKRLAVNQCYAIVGPRRCSCAIAYHSWLVSMLNIFTLKDLYDFHINPYAPGSDFFKSIGQSTTIRVLLEAWVAFHDIWGAVELYDQEITEPCDLEVRIRIDCSVGLRRHNLSLRTYRPETGAFANHYYVAAGFLLRQSLDRCNKRPLASMVLDNVRAVDAIGLTNDRREVLFEIVQHSVFSYQKRRYVYL